MMLIQRMLNEVSGGATAAKEQNRDIGPVEKQAFRDALIEGYSLAENPVPNVSVFTSPNNGEISFHVQFKDENHKKAFEQSPFVVFMRPDKSVQVLHEIEYAEEYSDNDIMAHLNVSQESPNSTTYKISPGGFSDETAWYKL